MIYTETVDDLVKKAGLAVITGSDREAVRMVMVGQGLDDGFLASPGDPEVSNSVLSAVEKGLKHRNRQEEMLALSLLRFLHAEHISGYRPLELEGHDVNFFAGLHDKCLSRLGRTNGYGNNLAAKAVRHFEKALELWKTLEYRHSGMLFRKARVVEAWASLSHLTGEQRYLEMARQYIDDLERDLPRISAYLRDSAYIERVLSYAYQVAKKVTKT